MDLILWRHAEAQGLEGDKRGTHDDDSAEEATDLSRADLDRALTHRGEKQAARMAQWLDRQLPEGTRVLVSPARRAEQTALALSRKYKIRPELAPGCCVAQLLEAAQWPHGKHPVLLVGHQPVLGQAVAQLLGLTASECGVKRGAVWWLRYRARAAGAQTVIVTVQSPEVL